MTVGFVRLKHTGSGIGMGASSFATGLTHPDPTLAALRWLRRRGK
jgi:hypothetical protein